MELGSFWGRLCRVLVPHMLCRSEDQFASPSREQGMLRGCGVKHLRADCHQAGKSSHCFWAGTQLSETAGELGLCSAPGTCALHHLGWGERTALVIKIKKTLEC